MKKLLLLGVILIGLFIFGYADVWGEDWKFYGGNDDYWGYYDAQSITRPSKNIIRVWEKWVYKVERRQGVCQSVFLTEIDCVNKKNRGLSSVDYSIEDKLLGGFSTPTEWAFIFPDSSGEFLYKKVCK